MVDAVRTIGDLKATTARLIQTPSVLQEIVRNLPAPELTRVTPADPWAIVQHLCHLRDLEREGFSVRIEKILSGSSPTLPDLNGEKLAIERAYISQDPQAALADFVRARTATVSAITNLTEIQLALTGTLEKVGPVTLGKILAMMRQHDEEHIELIKAVVKRIATQRRDTIQL